MLLGLRDSDILEYSVSNYIFYNYKEQETCNMSLNIICID